MIAREMPSKETEVGRDVVSAADCGVDRLAKARQGKAKQGRRVPGSSLSTCVSLTY